MCLYIESGRLLWFAISKEGIHLNILKVEAILNLPPLTSLHQLESLQGKANFLRCFIPNFAKIAKRYTCLLKHETPFILDGITQNSFEQLKTLVVSTPLLHPPDYHREYSLYLATTDSTIGMVLVQDNDDGFEHVIYYLSCNLINT